MLCAINRDPIVTIYNACAHTYPPIHTYIYIPTHSHSPMHPQHKVTKDPLVWFMFQKTKYLYEEREGVFKPLEFPVGLPCSHYHSWPGLASSAAVDAARQKYGKNRSVSQSVSQSVRHCTVACVTNVPIYVASQVVLEF